MRNRYLASLTLAAALSTVAEAAPVVYEPFNYGSTGKALSTVNGTALGLDGTSYAATHAEIVYEPTGLTFSNLHTSGGAAYLPWFNGHRNAGRGIDATLSGGTLFGSMLYGSGGAANTGVSGMLLGASSSITDNSARLAVMGNESESGTAANIAGVRMFGTKTIGSGTSMNGTYGETYLVLFQLTNVGASEGNQVFNSWVLTASQFDTFKLGGLDVSELNGAATGTGTANVLQKVSYTHAGPSYFTLGTSDYLKLFNYQGNARFDEIRLSGTSLDDVTPIPEPASIAILGGLLALGARRRRH